MNTNLQYIEINNPHQSLYGSSDHENAASRKMFLGKNKCATTVLSHHYMCNWLSVSCYIKLLNPKVLIHIM